MRYIILSLQMFFLGLEAGAGMYGHKSDGILFFCCSLVFGGMLITFIIVKYYTEKRDNYFEQKNIDYDFISKTKRRK